MKYLLVNISVSRKHSISFRNGKSLKRHGIRCCDWFQVFVTRAEDVIVLNIIICDIPILVRNVLPVPANPIRLFKCLYLVTFLPQPFGGHNPTHSSTNHCYPLLIYCRLLIIDIWFVFDNSYCHTNSQKSYRYLCGFLHCCLLSGVSLIFFINLRRIWAGVIPE